MRKLVERNAEEAYTFHRLGKTHDYQVDGAHQERLAQARKSLDWILGRIQGQAPAHICKRVIELGCAMSDIAGPRSWGNKVVGYEANATAILKGKARYPYVDFREEDLQTAKVEECDVLILCEILEHIENPFQLCERWLPKAKYALVSVPIGASNGSAGEHLWSFSLMDWKDFFTKGKHIILVESDFNLGVTFKNKLAISKLDDV